MSLLSEAMESFIPVSKVQTDDGVGGQITVWTDGTPINAAVVKDTSTEAKIAEKSGVTAVYTITTTKDINLQYHDVLRRVSDGMIFRVTSKGTDNCTPASAGLNMRQVDAEEWSIPE